MTMLWMAPSMVVQVISCTVIHSGPVGILPQWIKSPGRADILKIAMIITLSIDRQFELGEIDFSTESGYR